MSTPILATKLFIPPPRTSVVTRPRLIKRLNDGLAKGARLTLISASAGFGKTTLVSEWISRCENPVGWLSLDEGDSDPVRFTSYLIAALRTIKAGIGEELLTALQSHQPPSNDTLLIALLNEISIIAENFLLVLDDYHSIDSPLVDQSLDFIIEHQPPQMHLVIATREDPSLPLARLRARGQLTELRTSDLRFTPAEATEFLNRVMGLSLTTDDIASLEARTEGWIAGLQLAALSMQEREDTAGFLQAFTGSHRFVLDYLAEEVLQRQPEQIRDFLLQTSILDRLCAPLCNAITKQQDGKETLEILEHSNLFLIPLDDKRQWYRYHHLFADVLQMHLLEAQPEDVNDLHQRASEWYERNNFQADAIHHALKANAFERAAALIELAGPITEQGSLQTATWLGWVKSLPDELIQTRPVLGVWYAYALLGRGEMEAAEARLNAAERWMETAEAVSVRLSAETHPENDRRIIVTDKEQYISLPATISICRAYIAQTFGNIPDTVKYARRALELAPEENNFRHGQASMLLGMTYWASGDLEAAARVFAEYTMKLRNTGNPWDAISTSVVLADIRLALGHLHEAIDTLEQLLQFVMDHGKPIPLDATELHRELSKLYLEQGNLKAAAQHLQSSNELGEKAQLSVSRYRLCIDQAQLKAAQGDLEGALAFLDEAQRLYIRSPLPDFCSIPAIKARIWIRQDRLHKAREWADRQGLSVVDELSYLHEFEHMTLARVLIARFISDRGAGSIKDAISLLERLQQVAEAGKRMGSVIEILVLLAVAHAIQGNITSALVPMERALTLAAPEDYVQVFLDEGAPVAQLLSEAAARGIMRDYAGKLLAAFQNDPRAMKDKPNLPLSQPLIDPLSQRELDVLQLIAQGLSNRVIGERLFLALSTVKGYNQKIFDKLQVQSRTEAIARARELGLL